MTPGRKDVSGRAGEVGFVDTRREQVEDVKTFVFSHALIEDGGGGVDDGLDTSCFVAAAIWSSGATFR